MVNDQPIDRIVMKETDLWVKKLKEKLENHSEPLPASGWEQLEKELLPSAAGRKIYFYRKRMLAVAAVILLAVISSVSLYFLSIPDADDILRAPDPGLTSLPVEVPGTDPVEGKHVTVGPAVRPVAIVPRDRMAKAGETGMVVESVVRKEEEAGEREKEKGEETPPASDPIERESRHEPEEGGEIRTRPPRRSPKEKRYVSSKKGLKASGGWALALSVGNSAGAYAGSGDGPVYMTRVNTVTLSDGLMDVPDDKKLVFDEGVPYFRQSKELTEIKHRQPVSVGISVRKNLGSGFSVETGLNYTFLSSEAKQAGTGHKLQQTLHYLGIPVRANWNFLDKERFTLYLSGGGMAEKCVYGKLGSEKETVKPLQFSVSGAVGAQLNATKRLGFYVEPGVSYFFDDGSEVQTIRKENPFNFTVRAGVRLTY